jgi:hypothetical protein
MMRGSYAAKAPAPYGLPPATFIHIFGMINSTGVAPVSRSANYTAVLISARMIFVKSSKSLKSSSLFLSLWNASFTRRSNAFTRFSAASINIIVVSRAFSISRTATRLKNVVFSIYNYLFACFGVVILLFRRGASALAPYSGLYRLCFKPHFPLSTYISADILLLRCVYGI